MEVGDKFDGLIDELVKSGKTLDELLSEGGELMYLDAPVTKSRQEGAVAPLTYMWHWVSSWTMPVQNWKQALNQLSILFGERLGT